MTDPLLQPNGSIKGIEVWHNIMWSRYKARVFSELYKQAVAIPVGLTVIQIAETERDRKSLAPVDKSLHDYPYELIFRGSYSDISIIRRLSACMRRALKTTATFVLLAGYDRPEYWAQAFILRLRGKRLGVFCDSTMHDRTQHLGRYLLKRLFFSMVDIGFCYGQRSRDYLLFHGVPRNNIYQRCQAAWLPSWYSPAAALRDRLDSISAQARPRILFIGRLSAEKNLGVLIGAMKIIRATQDVECFIIGSGPSEQDVRDQVASYGLSDSVILLGPLSGEELYKHYSSASVLALPSQSEPWGLVVNEAFSFGCPAVVSVECGCVPELIVDGSTGYAVEYDDPEEFAQRLSEMLAQVDADPEAVAIRCQERISVYTPEKAAAAILNGIIPSL